MYRLIFSDNAKKQLKKMDRDSGHRVFRWLKTKIDGCDNPRFIGRALKGALGDYWRYRVGDYRVLCDIKDAEMVVLAIEIDHRRQVYR